MKHIISFLAIVSSCICLASCQKIDTSVSLSGTEWHVEYGTQSYATLSFTNIEFALTYTVKEKNDTWLPGEGYRIKGSYEYKSPEAKLYSRTVEYMFNGKVESVDKTNIEFTAIVVNDVLSLYDGQELVADFTLRQ